MTPHLAKAIRDFETAMDQPETVVFDRHGAWLAFKAALDIDARDREEVRVGSDIEGFAGALWRLIGQCDYRRIEQWMRGERVRNTPRVAVIDSAAAAISCIALQVAGQMLRTHMRPTAQEIMIAASEMLERDLKALSEYKKGDAVIRNNLRLLPGGK